MPWHVRHSPLYSCVSCHIHWRFLDAANWFSKKALGKFTNDVLFCLFLPAYISTYLKSSSNIFWCTLAYSTWSCREGLTLSCNCAKRLLSTRRGIQVRSSAPSAGLSPVVFNSLLLHRERNKMDYIEDRVVHFVWRGLWFLSIFDSARGGFCSIPVNWYVRFSQFCKCTLHKYIVGLEIHGMDRVAKSLAQWCTQWCRHANASACLWVLGTNQRGTMCLLSR